jgi:hypothetical protein
MSNQGNNEYYVDIVLCIDGTGSMRPFIENVKASALSIYSKLEEEMILLGKNPARTRVKVIVFGDYAKDADPMRESEFFELPQQNDDLHAYVNGITVMGGGDIPENAIEAIATAMKSDWVVEGGKNRRHVVVVFTDAPALELGARSDCPNYPTDLPKTMAELSAWWHGTDQEMGGSYLPGAGRLVAFVPNDASWTQFESWNRFIPSYTAAGGCSEIDMMEIIGVIASSFDA